MAARPASHAVGGARAGVETQERAQRGVVAVGVAELGSQTREATLV